LVRIYFVTDTYQVYDRVLGWRKDLEGGAKSLVSATMSIIDDFCTPCPPGLAKSELDRSLKAKIRDVVHGADVDGGADEQLCIRTLHSSGELPNMVRVGSLRKRSACFFGLRPGQRPIRCLPVRFPALVRGMCLGARRGLHGDRKSFFVAQHPQILRTQGGRGSRP
jgi:hypothetical protein